jgi:hypothetical protein
VLPVAARRWVLTDNTFWHTQWDHIDYSIDYSINYINFFINYFAYFLRLRRLHLTASSSPATSTPVAKMPNENLITYEELSEEHKQKYDEIKAAFEANLIGSFERTHHHGIRWKGFSHEGVLDEVDLSTPTEERTRALRQEVNYMRAHSLHQHSESLVNTLERVAVRVVQEIMKHQYSPTGPALESHKGSCLLNPDNQCRMHLQPQSNIILQLMLYTRWEVTLLITSSSANPPRRFRMDMFARIYQMVVTQRNPCIEKLEVHL